MVSVPAADGNRRSRAKQPARLELVAAIHGVWLSEPDKKNLGKFLRVRLLYGEDLRMLVRYIERKLPEDPEMAFVVLAVFPSSISPAAQPTPTE